MAFVVLHYNVIEETEKCVESICNTMVNCLFHILIVDNGSPNKSGLYLFDKYKKSKYVTVLQIDSNVGFARGNNAGIEYFMKNYEFDYLCCTNNDTIFFQDQFYETLNVAYNESNAAVIAPKVLLRNNLTQRFSSALKAVEYYDNMRKQKIFFSKHINLFFARKKLLNIKFVQKVNNFRKEKKNELVKDNFFENNHTNIVLHGCCLIFTKIFFEYLDGFDPRTFLYKEEELLFIKVRNKGLSTYYCTSLQIYHMEDAATNSMLATDRERHLFKFKNEIKSIDILIDEIKKSQ